MCQTFNLNEERFSRFHIFILIFFSFLFPLGFKDPEMVSKPDSGIIPSAINRTSSRFSYSSKIVNFLFVYHFVHLVICSFGNLLLQLQ